MRYFPGLPVKLYFFNTSVLVITFLSFLRSFGPASPVVA